MQITIPFNNEYDKFQREVLEDPCYLYQKETEVSDMVRKIVVYYQWPTRKVQCTFYFCKESGKYLKTYPMKSIKRMCASA